MIFGQLLGTLISRSTGGGGGGGGILPTIRACIDMTPLRHFKVKTSARLRCSNCYYARRQGTLYVRCRTHPRHKQRQGRATRKQQTY